MDSLYEALAGLKEDTVNYGTQGAGVFVGIVASQQLASLSKTYLFADGKPLDKAPDLVKKIVPPLLGSAVALAHSKWGRGMGGQFAESAKVGAFGYSIGALLMAFAPDAVKQYVPFDGLGDMPLLAGPNLAADRYLSGAPTTYEPARQLNGAPTTYERASTSLQYVPSPD